MKQRLKSLLITSFLRVPSIFASDADTSGSEDNRSGPAQPVTSTATTSSADPQGMYLRACALAELDPKHKDTAVSLLNSILTRTDAAPEEISSAKAKLDELSK